MPVDAIPAEIEGTRHAFDDVLRTFIETAYRIAPHVLLHVLVEHAGAVSVALMQDNPASRADVLDKVEKLRLFVAAEATGKATQ